MVTGTANRYTKFRHPSKWAPLITVKGVSLLLGHTLVALIKLLFLIKSHNYAHITLHYIALHPFQITRQVTARYIMTEFMVVVPFFKLVQLIQLGHGQRGPWGVPMIK